jgi:dephospho-CoA kinase
MAEGNGQRKNGRGSEVESSPESRYRRRPQLAGGKSITRPKIIGLTGGIASGKTTVAGFFKKWGAVVISGDELGWRVLQDRTIQKKLVALFGPEIISKGKINHEILGPKVFADKKTLLSFNRIVHPPLIAILKKEVQKARRKNCRAIVIDAALLAEWKIPVKLDLLLMVHSPKELQLKRLVAKGLGRKEALRRIASQMPYSQRRRLSDAVLFNSGTLAHLRQKSRVFWENLVFR